MNAIAPNPNPAMCRYLAQEVGLFNDDPVILIDVGARDGFSSEWSAFGTGARIIGFEPDLQECARLNAAAPPGVTYIPSALGRARQEQILYEARLSYSTGLYASNMEFFSRLLNRDNAEVVGQRPVVVDTLSETLARKNVHSVNFIKLDAEGAELDILLGANDLMRSSALFGIATEIRFHPEINGSPSFWQMDQFLQSLGLRMFDISANAQSRRVMPFPGVNDYVLPNGKRFYAYTIHGQVMDGDALYFRDMFLPCNRKIMADLRPMDALKLAALYELYYHNDAAAELIVAFCDRLPHSVDCEHLLNLLTPPLQGEKLSYRKYVAKYFDPQTSFAPSLHGPLCNENCAAKSWRTARLWKELRRRRPVNVVVRLLSRAIRALKGWT